MNIKETLVLFATKPRCENKKNLSKSFLGFGTCRFLSMVPEIGGLKSHYFKICVLQYITKINR